MEKSDIKLVSKNQVKFGDTFGVNWMLESNKSYEEVLAYCIENFIRREISQAEFKKLRKEASANHDHGKMMDLDYDGYYDLLLDDGTYIFVTRHQDIC